MGRGTVTPGIDAPVMLEDAADVYHELVFAEPLEGGHSVILSRLGAGSLHKFLRRIGQHPSGGGYACLSG